MAKRSLPDDVRSSEGLAKAVRWSEWLGGMAMIRRSADATKRPCDERSTERLPRVRTYSITASARSNTDFGMVRWSALAVFMLTTNSNVVGCWTGITPGFSPRATLPI